MIWYWLHPGCVPLRNRAVPRVYSARGKHNYSASVAKATKPKEGQKFDGSGQAPSHEPSPPQQYTGAGQLSRSPLLHWTALSIINTIKALSPKLISILLWHYIWNPLSCTRALRIHRNCQFRFTFPVKIFSLFFSSFTVLIFQWRQQFWYHSIAKIHLCSFAELRFYKFDLQLFSNPMI